MAHGEFNQSCPYFFTREGASLSLVGLYRGASAFLIAGGPSFAEIDKDRLNLVWTMTLNNASMSYRSNANCIVEDPSRFCYSMWRDPRVQKFVPFSVFEQPLWDNRGLKVNGNMEHQWRKADLVAGDCPNVVGYRRNENFQSHRFLREETISCGTSREFGGSRSVLLPALRILFLLGFRKVYLLGVDFKMIAEKFYHFPEQCSSAAVMAKNEGYVLMQRWFAELQPLFLADNFIVKNCNPKSRLTVFPFISFEGAIEEARASIGDQSKERSVGMYKKLEEKELEIDSARKEISFDQSEPSEEEPGAEEKSAGDYNHQKSRIYVSDEGSKVRRLLFRNFQSPGDIVMLTAAVRDLHKCYPGRFETDVETSCPQLWENNPYLTSMNEEDPALEVIDCKYPLIHRSNTGPWHFIQGFSSFFNEMLKIQIEPTDFKGDIHLSAAEKKLSHVQQITHEPTPYWIITAGGKLDYTIKWWSHDRFQSIIDHFRKKILFVQVGEKGHKHPLLNGVLDLRGKTNMRELVQLVYHSQGVLCPVTLLMHLAAAVEVPPGMPKNRPCVVIAGGREPPQWEAYPHHQFIHTNGTLPCCDNGGCWKSRTAPLADGDEKDNPQNLCLDVLVAEEPESSGTAGEVTASDIRFKRRNALCYPKEEWPRLLPRCMDMIKPLEVIRRIEIYFNGGAVKYLSDKECTACCLTIPEICWE